MFLKSFRTLPLPLFLIACAWLSGPVNMVRAAVDLTPGDTSFTTEHFSGSTNCAFCHDGLTDDSGADVSISRHWAATPMAHASRDPIWRAKVASEVARNPALKDVIHDKCLTCHAPMGVTETRFQHPGELVTRDGPNGILVPESPHYDASMEGVGCTLCHQITAGGLGTPERFSGNFAINTDRLIYGPYSDQLFAQPMINHSNYVPRYSPHISESRLCAACHELYTPTVDAVSGELTGGQFPEQTPFSEWLHSKFSAPDGETCQSCHMPRADGDLVISTRPAQRLVQRENFARHEFVGANTLLSSLLHTHRDELAVSSPHLAAQEAKQRAYLQTETADVMITSIYTRGNTFGFDVNVYTNTGHKFPTGFPSRRAYLHVTVTDQDTGAVVFESGRTQPDGSVTGVDSDADGSTYEPHHDVITREDQVQVYEAVMGNTQNQVTYTLLEGASYLKDNRLLPRGFDRAGAPPDIQPCGAAVNDGNFNPGWDAVNYEISGVTKGQALHISVDLDYQVLGFSFARDLLSDSAVDEVTALNGMLSTATVRHETVAHAETTYGKSVRFLRGDSNGDCLIDISDPITLLSFLFAHGAEPRCLDASDTNDNGRIDLGDAIYVLSFLFAQTDDPPAPFASCGLDPTDDSLGCTTYPMNCFRCQEQIE